MFSTQRLLTILYDVTATVAGETSLDALLNSFLRRMLFHTGMPAACILLCDESGQERLVAAVGDALLLDHLGAAVELPDLCCREGMGAEVRELMAQLPCRQGRYVALLPFCIPEHGKLLLFSAYPLRGEAPFAAMFEPLMGNLARQIELCRLHGNYRRELERKVEEASRSLRESREMFRLLLDSMAEGVYGIDAEGRLTFVNQSAMAMLGCTDSEPWIGRPVHEMVRHGHADGASYDDELCPVKQILHRGGAVHRQDERYWRGDGSSFPVEYRSFPIERDGAIVGAVVSFLDISERLSAEQEKQENERKMAHVQRLESLGVLAGGIAHDFNNLLTSIMGNASLARSGLAESEPAVESLRQIELASTRAAELCRQMLAYSGKGRFVIRAIDLSTTVESMVKLLEVSIPKNIVVRYNLGRSLPAVEADVTQVQQVIMNLVTNAAEAIGEHSGAISISTGLIHLDRRYLGGLSLDNEVVEGPYVTLEVADTGCGMDRATIARMFEPFFTTKFTGRGLGMSAVHGIIRGHRGAMKIYSEVGRGTTIKVFLPATGSVAEAHAAVAGVARPWQGSGRILVVDDEETVREVARLMLRKLGFEVELARDGLEGVELLRRDPGHFAAVLLDMSMPRMDGREAFGEMRRIDAGVKVILTSGYTEQDATQRFSGSGLAGFIQKPFDLATLRAAFQKTLGA